MQQAPVFMIDPNPAVRWPVTVRLAADGGRVADFHFEALIRVFAEKDYDLKLPKPPLDADGKALPRTISEVLAENAAALPYFVADWFGVRDTDGEVAISRLPELLLHSPYGPALSQGLWRAVIEVRHGLDPAGGANAKNSVTSPAAGPESEAATTN